MMLKKSKFIVVVFLMLPNVCVHAAVTCPDPASAIAPALDATVEQDKATGLYRYRYTMKNGSAAKLAISYFGVRINAAPNTSAAALHWEGKFVTLPYADSKFSWDTTAIDKATANEIPPEGDTSVPPAIYAIKPGQSLGGFEIVSDKPPGVVEFFAQGDVTRNEPVRGNEDIPSCPGFDPDNVNQVTGTTVGPTDAEIISVRIRARDISGLRSCDPIDPNNPKGKIAVLVLSKDNFGAKDINASTIGFGPAGAAPLSAKLVPHGLGKISGEAIAKWEILLDKFPLKHKDKKPRKPENLLLTFDVAALDVQCSIDQALVLRGKTNSGQDIVGSVEVKLAGCKPGKPGVHKKHRHKHWHRHGSR